MSRLLLSKSTLLREQKSLVSYNRFLPSLDMKRRQLMIAVKACDSVCNQLTEELNTLHTTIGQAMPMLANEKIGLDGLCKLSNVTLEKKNTVGVWVSSLSSVDIDKADIAVLGKPHWVDVLQDKLAQALELSVQIEVEKRKLMELKAALKKVTQRVNLFDKVLIPQTRANIKKVMVFLDDKNREAVITSKIAKSKRSVM